MEMRLEDLIEYLEGVHPEKKFLLGLGKPNSYRGFYEQLAFPLERNVSAGEMLANAKEAVGATYHGYKGGEFKMGLDTYVNIAGYGHCGSPISRGLLDQLFQHEVSE